MGLSMHSAGNPVFIAVKSAQVKNLLLCADSPHVGKEPDLAAEEVAFSLSPHNPLLLEANESQCHALLSACGRQLTLIQGPPGTGTGQNEESLGRSNAVSKNCYFTLKAYSQGVFPISYSRNHES